jgi:thiamine biosynthesis lipoprotein
VYVTVSDIYHATFFAMGTRLSIVLPGIVDDVFGGQIARMLHNEIERVEDMLSHFRATSEIGTLNAHAHARAVPVSRELFGILRTCAEHHQRTGGRFDITMRPLLAGGKADSANRASAEDTARLRARLGMDKILTDAATCSVRLADAAVSIDLGGMGKGYALARAEAILRRFGVADAFVSFGESSLLALGSQPGGDGWRIGIQDPTTPGRSIHTFTVRDGAVSTSGNCRAGDDGRLRQSAHVIDPRDGQPLRAPALASVCGPSPVITEILSTALLLTRDRAEAQDLSQAYPAYQALRATVGTDRVDLCLFSELLSC